MLPNEENEKNFANMKILFELILYFFECAHFNLNMLFCRTPLWEEILETFPGKLVDLT